MAHVFYYGLHPVSWFILFANVAISIMEWKFLVREFYRISTTQKEEEPKP